MYVDFETTDLAKAQELTNFVAALNVKHLSLVFMDSVRTNWVNFVLPKSIKFMTIKFESLFT